MRLVMYDLRGGANPVTSPKWDLAWSSASGGHEIAEDHRAAGERVRAVAADEQHVGVRAVRRFPCTVDLTFLPPASSTPGPVCVGSGSYHFSSSKTRNGSMTFDRHPVRHGAHSSRRGCSSWW